MNQRRGNTKTEGVDDSRRLHQTSVTEAILCGVEPSSEPGAAVDNAHLCGQNEFSDLHPSISAPPRHLPSSLDALYGNSMLYGVPGPSQHDSTGRNLTMLNTYAPAMAPIPVEIHGMNQMTLQYTLPMNDPSLRGVASPLEQPSGPRLDAGNAYIMPPGTEVHGRLDTQVQQQMAGPYPMHGKVAESVSAGNVGVSIEDISSLRHSQASGISDYQEITEAKAKGEICESISFAKSSCITNEHILDLDRAMDRTQKSQLLLQEWDRRMGLKQSHSRTMRKSSESRKTLQEMMVYDVLRCSTFGPKTA